MTAPEGYEILSTELTIGMPKYPMHDVVSNWQSSSAGVEGGSKNGRGL